MKFDNTSVMNFEGAFRGMRNPLESWDKSDSRQDTDGFVVGENDLNLAKRLVAAGSSDRKFLRQIFVCVDITAPTYFMAELDTYKVGTVRNSTSMQHKGTSHKYTINDFEVPEEIKEVLTIKEKDISPLVYPYETDEYVIYTCDNGRQYKVFKNGRVFSCEYDLLDASGRTRHFEEREVSPSANPHGYYELNMGGRNGEKWMLHRLVATCWIDNDDVLANTTIDHIDNNKGNNSVENLEWVPLRENIKREWQKYPEVGLRTRYLKWKNSTKISPVLKTKIKLAFYNKGETETYKDIADKFGLTRDQVYNTLYSGDKSEYNDLFEECWYWEQLLNSLNVLRDKYLETKDYGYFRAIRRLMPMGYLYKSTFTFNYEVLRNIYHTRKNHRLTEWHEFCAWIETLPYAKELITDDD